MRLQARRAAQCAALVVPVHDSAAPASPTARKVQAAQRAACQPPNAPPLSIATAAAALRAARMALSEPLACVPRLARVLVTQGCPLRLMRCLAAWQRCRQHGAARRATHRWGLAAMPCFAQVYVGHPRRKDRQGASRTEGAPDRRSRCRTFKRYQRGSSARSARADAATGCRRSCPPAKAPPQLRQVAIRARRSGAARSSCAPCRHCRRKHSQAKRAESRGMQPRSQRARQAAAACSRVCGAVCITQQ
jgi:hypothetical protein